MAGTDGIERGARPGATGSGSTSSLGQVLRGIAGLGGESGSASTLYREALGEIARGFASPYAAIYARCGGEVLEHNVHTGASSPAFWAPYVQDCLTATLAENRAVARILGGDAREPIGILSVPLNDDAAECVGGIGLVLNMRREEAPQRVIELEAVAALLGSVATRERGLTDRAESEDGRASLPALTHAAAMESLEQLAISITNGLRNRLNCEHVALGLVRGRKVQVLSVSGLDEVRPRSPGTIEIRGAMEECLDAGEAIYVDASSEAASGSGRYYLHRQWREASHGSVVASIPLCAKQGIVALLSLRRKASDPFESAERAALERAVQPYGEALLLVRDARRGVLGHLRDAVGRTAQGLLRRDHPGRKLALAGVLALAVWFAFGRLEYEVVATGRVVPASLRHVAMPFEGVLASANVVAGDRVEAGALLCVIEQRSLEEQRAELKATLAALEHEANAALAGQKPIEAQLARSNQALARARLGIVERRLERAAVRSPLSGFVVRGDLRKRVGAVLPQGEPLFEVAPLDAWKLELEAPEHVADELAAGLEGTFAGQARPEDACRFRVARVRPTSEQRAHRNVFVVECELDGATGWLRPGMEGTGQIALGSRPVWWICLHRALDYLRLRFWL